MLIGLVTSCERDLGIQVVWARRFSRSPTHFELFNSQGYTASEKCTLYVERNWCKNSCPYEMPTPVIHAISLERLVSHHTQIFCWHSITVAQQKP